MASRGASLTDNPLFEVSKVEVNGQSVTVIMTLKKSYDRFTDLKADDTGVTAQGQPLTLTVPGITVSGTAPEGQTEDLTATGAVTGTFTGTARAGLKANGYHFTWTATQTDEGLDSTLADASDEAKKVITLTVQSGVKTVPVTKAWEGVDASKAPAVTVSLLADGAPTGKSVELSSTNGWKAHFTDLPATKADGTTPIAYTVEEKPVPGYDSKVTGNTTDGFTVTNTKKDEPVVTPTDEPTSEPTTGPTTEPTSEPTTGPTTEPTSEPTTGPTSEPTSEPTTGPTSEPTSEPTTEPLGEPTASAAVTSAPTAGPGSAIPTARL